jgi:hypothetical protein
VTQGYASSTYNIYFMNDRFSPHVRTDVGVIFKIKYIHACTTWFNLLWPMGII